MNMFASLVVACVLGAALGGGQSYVLGHAAPPSKPIAPAKATDADKHAPSRIVELRPIITNLAAPPAAWIRLEAALVYADASREGRDVMNGEIAADFAVYLRSTRGDRLEGSLGLLELRDDLRERADIRSSGKVRDVLIETMVVQ